MESFGRYQIISPVARGGMAEILLARSAAVDGARRTVAIKRIREGYSSDLKFVSMFIDEARINIGLDHPNVVHLFDFGQVDGIYFMAMEYVDGTDLSALKTHLMRSGQKLPVQAALYIAAEILAGLDYAHAATDHDGNSLQIVHRDVSPQNILLSAAGEVKLTDFGIAAARNKLTQTAPGMVYGKSAYLSPEQARGEKVDGRTDIWSLGVVLYELLTGERLFASDSTPKTLEKVLNSPIPRPSMFRDEVSAEVDRVVRKALERDIARRYRAASSMRLELMALLDENPWTAEDMADFLAMELYEGADTMRPAVHPTHPITDDSLTKDGPKNDPELLRLYAELERRPNLWTLVEIAERLVEMGEREEAIALSRSAALLFASGGLMVQALCAHDVARNLIALDQLDIDLLILADVRDGDASTLADFWEHLKLPQQMLQLRACVVRSDQKENPITPLFGQVDAEGFVTLAREARVDKVGLRRVLIDEGEPGEALYAIGQGRAVVYCRPTEEQMNFRSPTDVSQTGHPTRDARPQNRVYLGGLADGDFFGEFSLLTGEPRSASVETVTPSRVLQLSKGSLERARAKNAELAVPLFKFYKERVVELMMAKNAVLGQIPTGARRSLLDHAVERSFEDQELVVKEGESDGALYFIRAGEAEVFRDDREQLPIFINKLEAGDFFGEIAALSGEPRLVSVRAMGELSTLRIERQDLLAVIAKEPKLKRRLEQVIRDRRAETEARVEEHARIFYAL